VIALDDAVGLRRALAGADVRKLGPRGDVALKPGAFEAGAVVGDEEGGCVLAGAEVGEVLEQRPAEHPLGLADRALDGRDRVGGGLGRCDRPGEHELGRVVDHVPGAPGAAARGLEFEEGHLPNPIAARRDLEERFSPLAGKVAAFADVGRRTG